MALPGRGVVVKVSGAPVAFTNAVATGDTGRTEFWLGSSALKGQPWDHEAAVSVFVSTVGSTTAGGTVASSAFTPNRLAGKVVFTTARSPDETVFISGQRLPLTKVAEGHDFSLSLGPDLLDVTEFSNRYIKNLVGLKELSGSVDHWYSTDPFFTDAVQSSSNQPFVLEFFSQATSAASGYDLRAWTVISDFTVESGVADAVDEPTGLAGFSDREDRTLTFST